MATLTQLKDARNAGLNLAKATQDFAQVDILSANKDAPAVVAAVKVAADAAIAAAAAVGGAAGGSTALVTSGLVAGVTATGTGTKVTLTVSNGAITAITLSE